MLEIVDCDALGVYTVGLIPERLSVFANHNLSEDFHKKMLSEYRDFLHTIIMDKKPVLLTNLPDDTNFGFPAFLKSCGYETSLSLPLVLRGLPLGIVLVLSKRKKHYHRKEIQYLEGICRQIIVAIEKIQNIQTIKEMSMESVMALVQAIEMRDPYTKGHSLQVSEIAFELGRLFELGDRELELLKFAGLLHDIGKIAIPEMILNKPAKLDEFEWEIMRKHPVKSAEIIQPIKNLSEIGKWILHHHERWDGTGYPAGLKGEEIPFYSRILAICDTYSAMLSDRPYRKKLSFKEAIEEIIRYKGKQFDPRIVEMFLTLPEEFLRRVVE
uniref:HD domain-containing protein n=1 Tax=candidate division WOR-3 bacterium TaxID=2052148 RepID=A0A7V3VUC0_UNCW3